VQRLHILRGVAYGLLTLHLSGLVHLDVKPANILLALLGSEIIAKLTDFSISWIVDPSSTFCAALTTPLCCAAPAHLARRRLRSPHAAPVRPGAFGRQACQHPACTARH
jgi:serine/threonine protein kinase